LVFLLSQRAKDHLPFQLFFFSVSPLVPIPSLGQPPLFWPKLERTTFSLTSFSLPQPFHRQ
jgi:hypothetical protein